MALKPHRWTRADLVRMPNDTNRYEVIQGALLVSPAPRPAHEMLAVNLRRLLEPFCDHEQLGIVSAAQAFVAGESEAIPDLVVRDIPVPPPEGWADLPVPLLVVEVLSASTRRSDETTKRAFYLQAGVAEYWVVDGEARAIRVIKPSGDWSETHVLRWSPSGASATLTIDVPSYFAQSLGPA